MNNILKYDVAEILLQSLARDFRLAAKNEENDLPVARVRVVEHLAALNDILKDSDVQVDIKVVQAFRGSVRSGITVTKLVEDGDK